MCEVTSCCCLSLRQGCVIIGGITMVVSLVQTIIFSVVLVETYKSYTKFTHVIFTNDSSNQVIYSFNMERCPVGFLAARVTSNKTNDTAARDDEDSDDSTNLTESVALALTATSASLHASPGPPLALKLTLHDASGMDSSSIDDGDDSRTLASSTTTHPPLLKLKGNDDGSSSSLLQDPDKLNIQASLASTEDDMHLILSSSSSPYSDNSSTTPVTKTPTILCAAQGQAVLWALVILSSFYSVIGGILIHAVIQCVTWQLSIWFFYSVGYDLFMLIVAMTDGEYTSISDISSYVVSAITVYCIMVVDSYYENLLQDERNPNSSDNRRRSSLVIVRSSPDDTPTSTQHEYIPPTSYTVLTDNNSLAPPPIGNPHPPVTLTPPPARTHSGFERSSDNNKKISNNNHSSKNNNNL